jgi:hypothetical protein
MRAREDTYQSGVDIGAFSRIHVADVNHEKVVRQWPDANFAYGLTFSDVRFLVKLDTVVGHDLE